MRAPNETADRCARCSAPATTVATVLMGRRTIELPLCARHRRDLLRGARRERREPG